MDLSKLTSKGTIKHHRRWVIYGPEGVGKSTLASKFPYPIFIDLEGGTKDLDVTRINMSIESYSVLKEIVEAIAKAPEYETVVFDTADKVDEIISKDIAAQHHVADIGALGFGQGYKELGMEWSHFLSRLSAIQKQIVFLAHSGTVKHEQPDELPSFDKFGIKTEKRSAAMLREWADEVLFLNFKTFVEKDASGKLKGKGGRKRMLYAQHTSTIEAKDRSGTLPAEFEAEWGKLSHLVDASDPQPAAVVEKKEEPAMEGKALQQLLDLCAIDNVSQKDVARAQAAVVRAYPETKPLEEYDEGTLQRLVGGWKGVCRWIAAHAA